MMNAEAKVIDLDLVADGGAVHNLAGKDRGVSARAFFKLDALDASRESVTVKVPDYLNAISPSFFLGLFSESILNLGGRDAFLDKYRFNADAVIMDHVANGIKRALALRGPIQK